MLGDGISHKNIAMRTHFAERCGFAAPYAKWHFIIAMIGKNRFAQLPDMHQVLLFAPSLISFLPKNERITPHKARHQMDKSIVMTIEACNHPGKPDSSPELLMVSAVKK